MIATILFELLARVIEWARPRRQRAFEIPCRPLVKHPRRLT